MSDAEEESPRNSSDEILLGPLAAVPDSIKSSLPYDGRIPPGDMSWRFDEFGFKVENDDDSQNLNKEVLLPDPQLTLKWIAFLEFQNDSDIQWLQITERLQKSEKLANMLDSGLPHTLRPHVWMRMSGASERKASSEISYKEIVKLSNNDSTVAARQIEKDLLRTLPTNCCFGSESATGVQKLRRVLRSVAYMYPDIGYCQGMGTVVASLLLVTEEEDAFWIMSSILEEYLPASYYTPSLLGVQADQEVLRDLVATHLPSLDTVLKEHDIELSLVTINWFMTIFSSVLPFRQLLTFWDNFFLHGSIVLFKLSLMLLSSQEEFLRTRQNSGEIFSAISNLVAGASDAVKLLKEASETFQLDETSVELQRRKSVAQLLSDQGTLVGNPQRVSTLPKERLNRRKFKSAKSNIQNFIFGRDLENDDMRTKNIKTTEILVDLREAILQIGRHFHANEPSLSKISLIPDFSLESHSRDIEVFTTVSRSKQRRAKALVDFERSEEDELGFRRNDVITIISQKDEHCWIGELNGLKGWFPAKFVQLLDERSKEYSKAGDDSVSEVIADFVRGGLCPAVKQILEYGLKKPTILGTPCHPWLFVEEAATRQVEKDFNSVYSRLVLCKTFRLDEDGKVLTPEELLYRCIQAVNITHDAVHAQMDVKLRSLICLGLNEQALHLWLEVLCSATETVQKWYQPWSFLSSPAWIQIKCELRVLSQFSFNLNPDWELPVKSEKSQPIRDGVRDMLVKHHLFSWDL